MIVRYALPLYTTPPGDINENIHDLKNLIRYQDLFTYFKKFDEGYYFFNEMMKYCKSTLGNCKMIKYCIKSTLTVFSQKLSYATDTSLYSKFCEKMSKTSWPIIRNEFSYLYENLGLYNMDIKNFQLANYFLNKCLEIRVALYQPGKIRALGNIYENIGVLYQKMKDYPIAKEFFMVCEKIRKASPNVNYLKLADTYEKQGILAMKSGKGIKALILLTKSANLKERAIFPSIESLKVTYRNIIKSCELVGETDLADQYFKKLSELNLLPINKNLEHLQKLFRHWLGNKIHIKNAIYCTEIQDHADPHIRILYPCICIAMMYINIGHRLFQQRNLPSTTDCLERAQLILNEGSDCEEGKAILKYHFGELYIEKNDFNKALECYKQSINGPHPNKKKFYYIILTIGGLYLRRINDIHQARKWIQIGMIEARSFFAESQKNMR